MKKPYYTLILLLFSAFVLRAQSPALVISEFMYNDPSGGGTGDSLEFIEIYNADTILLDLTGYQFTAGVTFTFPLQTIAPGSYLVIARNATAVQNFFNISGVLQWDAGQSLTNQNGEAIVLRDSTGNIIDTVRYYPGTNGWPAAANGLGATCMLCDPLANNNLGASWTASNIINANTFGLVNNITVYATPGSGCILAPPYYPTFVPIPVLEGFDSTWVNGSGLRDVPSTHWKNTPSMGNDSWRRDDDGAAAGWTNAGTGAYTPAGAENTIHSARFHAIGVSGVMDFYLDFTTPGLKKLKFWYINMAGTDSTAVLISVDSGQNFVFLKKYLISTAWQQSVLELGTSTSSHVILRFRATGNAGQSDMGIDQVNVYLAPPNDAGVSAITQPASPIQNPTSNVVVNIHNYGNAVLDSVMIGWDVNGVAQLPFAWYGSLAPGTDATGIVIGPYTFAPLMVHNIRAWTYLPNGNPDADSTNDLSSLRAYIQPWAVIPYLEGFDSVWTDKLGTREVPSLYWHNTPITGNNSWRRNDDGASAAWTNAGTGAYNPAGANGTTNSSRFHSGGGVANLTGTLDLYLNLSPAGIKELRFWHINTSGNDSLAVWISHDAGSSFSFLAKFTAAATWTPRAVLLGPAQDTNVIIRFRCTTNGNTDVGLDQVSVDIAKPDAGTIAILSPVSGCSLGNANVTVKIKNFGNTIISALPVTYLLNGNPVTDTIQQLINPGDTVTHTFSVQASLSTAGVYALVVYPSLPDDPNALNDTLKSTIYSIIPVSTFPFLENFETGGTNYFIMTRGTNATIGVENSIGNNGTWGLHASGNVAGTWPGGSGSNTTANQAWNVYTDHQTSSYTCNIDATSLSHPLLKLDLRQTYINNGGPMYSWFRVMINDTFQAPNLDSIFNFNPATQNGDIYATQTFDLENFANTSFKLTLQTSCKYNDAYAGGAIADNVYIDNVLIMQKPPKDMAVTAYLGPATSCGLTAMELIGATFYNNGSIADSNFLVSYSVNGGVPVIDTVVAAIQPNQSLNFMFTQPASFSTPGPYTIIIKALQQGDPNPLNDSIIANIFSFATINLGVTGYFENFEGTTQLWTSASITGANEWEFGLPLKPTLNSAHSGVNTWTTGLSQNYHNASNSYIISPCMYVGMIDDPYLSVYLNMATQNNNDAMVLEYTANSGPWTKYEGDPGFYNNQSATGPVTPPKWSGNSGGWKQFSTSITDLKLFESVQFRFRFQTDNNTTAEGISLDDINIFDAIPDIMVTNLLSPNSGCEQNGMYPLSVSLENIGIKATHGFQVTFKLNNNSPVTETCPDTIQPGQLLVYTFATQVALAPYGVHNIKVWVADTLDLNPLNDTLNSVIYNISPIYNPPYFTNFDSPGYFNYLGFNAAVNSAFSIEPGIGMGGTSGVKMSGGEGSIWPAGSSTTTTAAQAYSYSDHLAELFTCNITLNTPVFWGLGFALRQTYSDGPKYSWLRVMLNDTIWLKEIGTGDSTFNPATPNTDPFINRLFPINNFGSPVNVRIQAACKYNDANSASGTGDNAFIDDLHIFIIIGMDDPAALGMAIYPNPAQDKIKLHFSRSLENAVVEMNNIDGRLVFKGILTGSNQTSFDISTLRPGVYSVSVKTNEGMHTLKFVKTN